MVGRVAAFSRDTSTMIKATNRRRIENGYNSFASDSTGR